MRDAKPFPCFKVTNNKGTLWVSVLDHNRVRVFTRHNVEYAEGLRQRYYTETYDVNRVQHSIDVDYVYLEGNELIGHWYSDTPVPDAAWVVDRKNNGYQFKRADWIHSNKWVTSKAYDILKQDTYDVVMQVLKENPDVLSQAHEVKRNNDIREREVAIEKKYKEISDLLEEIGQLERAD